MNQGYARVNQGCDGAEKRRMLLETCAALGIEPVEDTPRATDDVFRPAKVAAAVQANLVDKLGFANAPAAFTQGPNGGG